VSSENSIESASHMPHHLERMLGQAANGLVLSWCKRQWSGKVIVDGSGGGVALVKSKLVRAELSADLPSRSNFEDFLCSWYKSVVMGKEGKIVSISVGNETDAAHRRLVSLAR
jgi:hypothetical protein